jgi:hypothetical protein
MTFQKACNRFCSHRSLGGMGGIFIESAQLNAKLSVGLPFLARRHECEQQFGFSKCVVMRFACRKWGRKTTYFRESKGSLSEKNQKTGECSQRARRRKRRVGAKWPAAISIIEQLLSLVDILLSPIDFSDLISIFAFVCEIQTLFARHFDRITQ